MELASRNVGIYLRISSDVQGEGLGVERQETACRKLCDDRGWTVVEVFSDNDVSAYSRKPRPRYGAMLDAVRQRHIDTIVAWHPDRLHRQMRELVPFIDLVNKYTVHIETVQAGGYDLSTPEGRLRAEITGSVAAYESGTKSARIRAKLEQNASKGKHHGGSRPFGWMDDRVTVDPLEAEVVREATALLLSGESVKGTARILNEQGHTTATGKAWRDVTVRDMVLRPRNAGIRIHHGEELKAGSGDWEPIVALADFRQVQALLQAPGRRTSPGRDGKVHLLSGSGRCGVCGGPTIVAKSKVYDGLGGRHSGGRSIYRCKAGHVARDQERVDLAVERALMLRLKRPDARRLLIEPDKADAGRAAAERVQHLQDRLQDAAKAFAAGAIDLAMMTTIRADLLPEIEKSQAQASSPNRSKVLAELIADPENVWKGLTPERKRAVVRLLMTVTIKRTTTGPNFDPDSIEVVWR